MDTCRFVVVGPGALTVPAPPATDCAERADERRTIPPDLLRHRFDDARPSFKRPALAQFHGPRSHRQVTSDQQAVALRRSDRQLGDVSTDDPAILSGRKHNVPLRLPMIEPVAAMPFAMRRPGPSSGTEFRQVRLHRNPPPT